MNQPQPQPQPQPRLVEEAMNLAQSGKIRDALEVVAQIRGAGGFGENSDVSIEIMVTEGMCSLYSGDTARAEDRFGRAAAIGSKLGSKSVRGLALCWLAIHQISRGQHLEAAKSVIVAKQHAEFCRPDVRFRITLVLSMLLEYSGCRADSLVWFDSARKMLESIRRPELMVVAIYNLAMVRLGSELISRLKCGKLTHGSKATADLLFVRSAESYAARSAAKVRFELHDLTSAYALALCGDHQAALMRCERFLNSSAAIAPVDFARAKFCDVFSKFAMSIDVGDLSDLHERLLDLTDNDDLAIAHDTLSRIYESRHDFISAEFHLLESRRHLELFDATGVSIRSVFVEAGYLLKT